MRLTVSNVIKIRRQSLANAGKNARGTEEVEKRAWKKRRRRLREKTV